MCAQHLLQLKIYVTSAGRQYSHTMLPESSVAIECFQATFFSSSAATFVRTLHPNFVRTSWCLQRFCIRTVNVRFDKNAPWLRKLLCVKLHCVCTLESVVVGLILYVISLSKAWLSLVWPWSLCVQFCSDHKCEISGCIRKVHLFDDLILARKQFSPDVLSTRAYV